MNKRTTQSPKTHQPGSSQELKSAARLSQPCYPFSAIVAQDEMKLALILNVIDPRVGGVLIMGHRGTGKSTVVRALADLLPPMPVVSRCAYRCDPADDASLCLECTQAKTSGTKFERRKLPVPVVELPLGATEDRVCGTIDIEQALGSGVKRFEPGLLARANRGFLYIDEVNLLEDHLVDLLLDVAATGINRVERESISVEHPAQFVLIGSGNPEEGELRPQLLDRFGLYVEVTTEDEIERRVEIVERRDAFERERESFRLGFAAAQDELRNQITRARKNLGGVKLARSLLRQIAQLCSELNVDGHRGELTITRAARALAALAGRRKVDETDVKRVAVMALRHRLRRDLLEEAASAERIEQALEKVFGNAFGPVGGKGDKGDRGDRGGSAGDGSNGNRRTREMPGQPAPGAPGTTRGSGPSMSRNGDAGAETETMPLPRDPTEIKLRKLNFPDTSSRESGRRGARVDKNRRSSRQTSLTKTVYDRQRGRYARSTSWPLNSSPHSRMTAATRPLRIALDATLRALLGSTAPASARSSARFPAAAHKAARKLTPVSSSAVRFKLFKRKQGRLFIFAIDLSGSMALNRIVQAKGTMFALLRQSYVKRDSVAIIGFRGASAELLLPPSRSILRARRVLDSLGVGGGTPLSAGLACALQLAKRTESNSGELVLLLFTDGRANVSLSGPVANDRGQREGIINNEIAQLGQLIRKAEINTTVIDTQNSFRANDRPRLLAEKLGARYVEIHRSETAAA